ncbi:MAG: alpha/beta hydrolase [Bacteroidota bacterium]
MQNPIDYQALRKNDVYMPRVVFFRANTVTFKVRKTRVTEIKPKAKSEKLLIYIHGGAFVSGPSEHHWNSIKKIAKKTDYTIWMCDYPKAPEHIITEISQNIDMIFQEALQHFSSNKITLMGDSVGGTLCITLVQRAIEKNLEIPLRLVLISPVVDATMSNPEIEEIDIDDPMLSKTGVLSAKIMCAGTTSLKNPAISPIYGSFEKFPTTMLYLAENDITYPDQRRMVKRMLVASVQVKVNIGKEMPHIWPLLPVMKESKVSMKEIIRELNS